MSFKDKTPGGGYRDTTRSQKNTGTNWGILILLMKLGPKIAAVMMKSPILAKVAKSVFGIKSAGAAASLGLYSLILSWEMGVSLVAFILIHESGHLWAMKKCGIKTKGIYLIPGFGGAAVAAESFRNSRNEMFIALMGPLGGLLFIVPMIVLYFLTKNPLFAAIASIMAFINLLNLFPINPLDGGRIVKSLLYSFRESMGFFVMIFGLIAAVVISFFTGFFLLLIIAIIGLQETIYDYGLKEALSTFVKTIYRLAGAYTLYLWIIPALVSHTAPWWALALFSAFGAGIAAVYVLDMLSSSKKENSLFLAYPLIVAKDILRSIRELVSIKPSSLKRIDDYEQMTKSQTMGYGLAYVATIIGMIALIIYAGSIPGAELARDLLR